MTTLMRWNPFMQVSDLRRTMDILEDFAPIRMWRNVEPTRLSFPTDLFETDDNVVVKAVLPGIKPEDVEITVVEGVLGLLGEVPLEVAAQTRVVVVDAQGDRRPQLTLGRDDLPARVMKIEVPESTDEGRFVAPDLPRVEVGLDGLGTWPIGVGVTAAFPKAMGLHVAKHRRVARLSPERPVLVEPPLPPLAERAAQLIHGEFGLARLMPAGRATQPLSTL